MSYYLTISCNLHVLALIGFSVLSDWDLHFWSTDLKIHGLFGRSTVYIPAKFHRNSLKNNGENALQQFLRGCLLMILTFDLYPRCFIRSFPCHGLSTSEMWGRTEKSLNVPFQTFLGMMKLVKLSYLENYPANFKSLCSNGFSDHGFRITFSSNSLFCSSLNFSSLSEILISTHSI